MEINGNSLLFSNCRLSCEWELVNIIELHEIYTGYKLQGIILKTSCIHDNKLFKFKKKIFKNLQPSNNFQSDFWCRYSHIHYSCIIQLIKLTCSHKPPKWQTHTTQIQLKFVTMLIFNKNKWNKNKLLTACRQIWKKKFFHLVFRIKLS